MGKLRRVNNKTSTFQDAWLDKVTHSEFSTWLGKSTLGQSHAYCKFCNKHFDISGMGICAVRSHAGGAKHKELVKNNQASSQSIRTLLSTSQPSEMTSQPIVAPVRAPADRISENPSTSNADNLNKSINSMDRYVKKDDVTKAEIIWALNHADKKKSVRCSGEESEVFKLMFPDSEIAQKYQMKKDKISYSITYGLGPHFQNQLANIVRNCEFFTSSFDESLNKFAKKGQMDVVLRFWPEGGNKVESRYLTSAFLQRATAADLFAAFKGEALDKHGLSIKKMLQVSLDGPNVNKKFLKDLAAHLNNSEDAPQLLDIGHCILHIVHGAYKTGHKEINWNIDKFLRALYYHFYKSPSRRGIYTACTKSNLFPEKYCATRFLENSKALKRVDDMLEQDCLLQYFKNVKADDGRDSNDKSSNAETIKEFLDDVFLRPKIRFMLSVITELEPFLTMYQTDWPMIPFMRNDLFNVIKDLMSRVVKKDVLAIVKSTTDLLKIDLSLQSNLLPASSVNIGIGANTSISALRKKNKKVTDLDVMQFKNKCRALIIKICQMLVQKAPLSSILLQGAACLSPKVMLKEKTAKYRVEIALTHLVEKNRLNGIEADNINKEYCQFISKSEVRDKLKTFDVKKNRIDTFLFEIFSVEKVSDGLKKFAKIILIMFHGNADVERSFSYNKEFLVENLQEESLIALRNVHDAIRAAGGIQNIQITSDMTKAFLKAPSNRKAVLDQKQSDISKEKEAKKRAASQLIEIELKKKRMQEEYQQELNLLQKEEAELKKLSK